MIETKFSHVISQFSVSLFYPLIYRSHFHFPPGFTQRQLYGEIYRQLYVHALKLLAIICYLVCYLSVVTAEIIKTYFSDGIWFFVPVVGLFHFRFYKSSTNKRLEV